MSSKTFIMLKPDALERGLVDKVIQYFILAGFNIKHIHYSIVDKALITEHYKDVIKREGPEFVEWLNQKFVGKPALSMILTYPQDNGIEFARSLLGNRRPEKAVAGTIRGDLGIPEYNPVIPAVNLIHASDNIESFEKETKLWFGDQLNDEMI